MRKTLDTLVDDVSEVLDGSFVVDKAIAQDFGRRMEAMLLARFNGKQRKPAVSGSNFGHPCDRKAWLNINTNEVVEQVDPQLRLKFLYGDLVEELVLTLVRMAGHEVTGEQDVVEGFGIAGSRDCLIDGQTVDVKSASGYGIRKFKYHELIDNDPFAYLPQVSFYRTAPDGGKGASFLVIDKVAGELVLDSYTEAELYSKEDMEVGITETLANMKRTTPPPRTFDDVPDGKAGNMCLGTNCKYCNAKFGCYPSLKVYNYSNGPRFFTKLVKRPQDKIANITRAYKKEKGLLDD